MVGQHAAQVAGQCAVPVEEPEVFVGLLMAPWLFGREVAAFGGHAGTVCRLRVDTPAASYPDIVGRCRHQLRQNFDNAIRLSLAIDPDNDSR
ncbi:hypothetical protein Vse01_36020 [Micromonospora sediminimaris]|uniref:Uncharacterized protein n=1 Tax=Micromonospora sediminimaris TaxID=547162 RepID=A0A9W5URL3_9ACTN|nr:hypothetical protein Vse01_36020 [Micromonospora sediminimaris]